MQKPSEHHSLPHATMPPDLSLALNTNKPDQPPLPAELMQSLYKGMVQVRAYDERALKLQRSGRIGFFVTSFGEEAAQIGVAAGLTDEDWLFPSYRQQGVAIYRGIPMQVLVNQLFGNVDDVTKGRQMPVHYSYKAKKFVTISSVIGTQISQAVGCAMAAKIRKDPSVTATWFGDGASSANDFHAGMNLAGVSKAPVLFICTNNQYAISLPVSKQTACDRLADKAIAYGMPGVQVDGNDVIAVYKATREAADRARRGEGPTLLELLTYRAGAHSSSDDPTRYRDSAESEQWQQQDPLLRMRGILQEWNLWTEAYEESLWEDARNEINSAITEAEKRPLPEWSTLFDDVYAELPPHLQEQRDTLIARESGIHLTAEGEFPL